MSEYAVIQHLKKQDYSLIPSIYSCGFEDKPWTNDWFKIPQFNTESNWIAYYGEEAIGFVISFISNELPYISVLAVDPKHQNKGVGRQLIEYAIKYWLSLDYENIRLHVSFERKTALSLYQSMGFEIVGKDEDSYELLLNLDIIKSDKIL